MYEQDDERSYSAGKGGTGSGRGGVAALLAPQQPEEVHTGAVIRAAGTAGVFPFGLPWACDVDSAVVGPAGSTEVETHTKLFHTLLCRRPAAKKRGATRLLDEAVGLARSRGLIASDAATGAIDSTGLETRHVSVHYAKRSWRQRGHYKRRYPKLSALCDIDTHIILAAVVDRGPKPDIVEFQAVLEQALKRQPLQTLLGDAGYESEAAHRLCRETYGVRSIIPTTNRGRRRKDSRPNAVTGKYRQELHEAFPKEEYGQRWQVETVFSSMKRRLGSALRRRRPFAINREVLLKVITYNLMVILYRYITFQQSM